MSIRDRGGAFETLPPPAAMVHERSHVRFDAVELPAPLETLARRDPWPLPRLEDREGYHVDRNYAHWQTGLLDYHLVRARACAHAVTLAPGDRVLDLGCASGRALRHFACQFPHDMGGKLDLWGVDINAAHIRWVQEHLDGSIRALQCHALPHLPIEDNSVRLAYAFSVFTHIDEFELAWLCELRRLLAPGGLAYISFHSEKTWANAHAHRGLGPALLNMHDAVTKRPVAEADLRAPLAADRLVLTYSASERLYSKNVFHTTDYIRRTWERFMTVLEVWEGGHAGHQDVALLRKDA